MTTYLATAYLPRIGPLEETTAVYCSWDCREDREIKSQSRFVMEFLNLDSYEFDEVCANCGKLVLASHN
jgi:hypothetical protein